MLLRSKEEIGLKIAQKKDVFTLAILLSVIVVILFAITLPYFLFQGSKQQQQCSNLSVALVVAPSSAGLLNDGDMALTGLRKASQDMGIRFTYDFLSQGDNATQHLLNYASSSNVSVIIGVGKEISRSLAEVAKMFPGKLFVGIRTNAQDYSMILYNTTLKNLIDINFNLSQLAIATGIFSYFAAYYSNSSNIAVFFDSFSESYNVVKTGYYIGINIAKQNLSSTNSQEIRIQEYNFSTNESSLNTYNATLDAISNSAKVIVDFNELGAYGVLMAIRSVAIENNRQIGPPYYIGVKYNYDWVLPGFVLASVLERIDNVVYTIAELACTQQLYSFIENSNGKYDVNANNLIDNVTLQGIGISNMNELSELFTSSELHNRSVIFYSKSSIFNVIYEMRNSFPSEMWNMTNDLVTKIS